MFTNSKMQVQVKPRVFTLESKVKSRVIAENANIKQKNATWDIIKSFVVMINILHAKEY